MAGAEEERKRAARAEQVALFRYQLVREAADPALSTRQRGRMVREIASRAHEGPFGDPVTVSRGTVDRWIRAWRDGGFAALAPPARQVTLRTDAEVLEMAAGLKRENPARTAAQVRRILVKGCGWSPSVRTLQRPIAAAGDVPDGLVIPALAAGYVSPAYRSTWASPSSRLDQEPWWAGHPVQDDLQGFMVRYLTSAQAVTSPLVILGQPGSGKSVLTKILAARLPARDFLAIRVELREVPADADLQSQIEYAIRDATGEALSWPALARTAGDALPVVILDGFDELLQATGIGQTDYLEQITRFQEREADEGRPVAVIITSRTAVADRARLPPGGIAALRLEPFSIAQVRSWLATWNGLNVAHLQSRGLRPLPVEAVTRQPDLASQPLLLLLLAFYDADGNALQDEGASLGEADLYEAIFSRFAEREVRKDHRGLAGAPLLAAVEEELLQLSVAAFAMFNRGRQWVTDDELSADLAALLGTSTTPRSARGFHAPPTAAQLVIGRFFFIHQAQAIRNDALLTSCEFLHATFGEFLVARLITRDCRLSRP
jgi:transposase